MGSGSLTFVHAADLHLDSQFKGLERAVSGDGRMPDCVLRRLRNSSFDAFSNIVDLCIDKKVDFLLLAGDIYDVADKSLRAQLRFRDGLARLADAGIPAFVVHGNHDHCSGWRAEIKLPDTVHIFSDKDVESRPVVRDGREIASVSGISYPGRAVVENYSSRFARGAGTPFAIALLHCNVGGIEGHENYAPCRLDDLLRKGFDYWALGHVHNRAILNPAGPCVAYPGCPQGRHPRETGEKGCLLVRVTENSDVAVEFFSTAPVRWESVAVSIEGIADDLTLLENIEDKLFRFRAAAGGKPIVARVLLNGRGSLHKNLVRASYAENLVQELRSRLPAAEEDFLWLDSVRVATSAEVDKNELADTDTLLGDFLSLVKKGRVNQDLKAELRKTLAALIEHPRAGRYLTVPDDDELGELLEAAGDLAVDLLWDGEE
ncbi:DNA repair exonuclease [Pelotomaculum isophthalicicum JI]|uniref:DNA repair exonuclease n=1 Tax=Pelotomaculum isophthalicicum JI TaxID=947010 RepID=A0A9X4JW47_9FIRM|nr:DNA repair exonuclease [Pelotomaculum isophthalicicum]MDF9408473.1 DNA repair exonuclease [Pelotomaculum isophthalicicum JI]